MALQMRYDLPLTLAKLLDLLARTQVVTVQMIEDERRITKDAKVAIHRLRRRMEASGIEIKSRRDFGYWLEKEHREQVFEAMKSDQLELPLGDGGNGGAAAA
jgi:Rad3-related DNA helicase